jgi:preprotein translocase subunit YajC
MLERVGWLAQMNTTPGTAPAGGGAGTSVGPAPAAPSAVEAPRTATGGGAAVTTQPGAAETPETQKAPQSPWAGLLNFLPIILMFVALYFFMFRGQRKEEKRRKDQIAELKKGDRVMTIGGLMARVVSIDGDEVVLKIDESANVKATYRKSAIQEVLVGDEKK